MRQALATVVSNMEVRPHIYLMWIEAPDIAAAAQPGQFVTVQCDKFTLRRPFSAHQASSREIAILFKVTGKGTDWLSQRQTGEQIDILGPLGKGFTIPPRAKNLLLIAGGIGIAPIVYLMQHAFPEHQITLIHGASTAAQLYPLAPVTPDKRHKTPHLPEGVQYIAFTEDGSFGRKGMATDILSAFLDWADQIYACGPLDMYKAMADISRTTKLGEAKLNKCQVSLEVRLGCGFGVCYGCTINTKKGLKQVCRHGPVFELQDIIWQEIKI